MVLFGSRQLIYLLLFSCGIIALGQLYFGTRSQYPGCLKSVYSESRKLYTRQSHQNNLAVKLNYTEDIENQLDPKKKFCSTFCKTSSNKLDQNIRIYVYNLSDYGVTPQLNHLFNPDICNRTLYTHSNIADHPMRFVCNYGVSFQDQNVSIPEVNDQGAYFYRSIDHGLSIFYHYRMMTSKYRVARPEDANLYFIPYYTSIQMQTQWFGLKYHPLMTPISNKETARLMWDVLRHEFSYWNRSRGSDHFILNDFPLQYFSLDHFDDLLFPPLEPTPNTKSYMQKLNIFTIEDSYSVLDTIYDDKEKAFVGKPPENRYYIPYVSPLHFSFMGYYPGFMRDYLRFVEDKYKLLEQSNCDCKQLDMSKVQRAFKDETARNHPQISQAPYNKYDPYKHHRGYLATYLGGTRKQFKRNQLFKIKIQANDQCIQDPDCKTLDQEYAHPFGTMIADYMVNIYLNSTFCLTPTGDTYTRKGLWDALSLGCIPVIFDVKSAIFPMYINPLQIQDYAILLDGKGVVQGQVKIMDELRKVTKERIKLMQRNIITLQYKTQYSITDNYDNDGQMDALETAITQLGDRVLHQKAQQSLLLQGQHSRFNYTR